ncbi:hypothetical protein C8R43DRAFT_961550 [Mycena crocata]|nr:hypothetical protein C8R43DRAFT_961550 [Mycena crocata]
MAVEMVPSKNSSFWCAAAEHFERTIMQACSPRVSGKEGTRPQRQRVDGVEGAGEVEDGACQNSVNRNYDERKYDAAVCSEPRLLHSRTATPPSPPNSPISGSLPACCQLIYLNPSTGTQVGGYEASKVVAIARIRERERTKNGCDVRKEEELCGRMLWHYAVTWDRRLNFCCAFRRVMNAFQINLLYYVRNFDATKPKTGKAERKKIIQPGTAIPSGGFEPPPLLRQFECPKHDIGGVITTIHEGFQYPLLSLDNLD